MFNDTIRMYEAFIVVLRYLNVWVIKQVFHLMPLAKSSTGEEVAIYWAIFKIVCMHYFSDF